MGRFVSDIIYTKYVASKEKRVYFFVKLKLAECLFNGAKGTYLNPVFFTKGINSDMAYSPTLLNCTISSLGYAESCARYTIPFLKKIFRIFLNMVMSWIDIAFSQKKDSLSHSAFL